MMALALALTIIAVAMMTYLGGEADKAVASERAAKSSPEPSVKSDPPEEARQRTPTQPQPESGEKSPPSARMDRPVSADGELEAGSGPNPSDRPRDTAGASTVRAPEHPNIVVVLTDDLDTGSISHMPKLQSLLIEKGAKFDNAFVTDPMCCPARATFLRGQYPHNTKVKGNSLSLGGTRSFVDWVSTTRRWRPGWTRPATRPSTGAST